MNETLRHEQCYGTVHNFLNSTKRPHQGFYVDVVDYGFKPGQDTDTKFHTFALRVYKENLLEFSTGNMQDCLEWVTGRLEAMKTLGPADLRVGLEVEDTQ